jgi:hypothetical protein
MENTYTFEDVAQYEFLEESYTCYVCVDNKDCIYAYDPYNTDGDCLADK